MGWDRGARPPPSGTPTPPPWGRGARSRGRLVVRETSTGRIRGTTMALDASARQLRQDATPAERALWEHLRGHRLAGLGCRRQHPNGPFVVDFACPSRLLALELDGSVHDEQRDQDAERTAIPENYGSWSGSRTAMSKRTSQPCWPRFNGLQKAAQSHPARCGGPLYAAVSPPPRLREGLGVGAPSRRHTTSKDDAHD